MSNAPEASAPPQLLTQAGVTAAFFWWPRLFARRLLRGLVYALFLLSLAINVVAARWVDLRPEAGKQFARAMEVEDAVVYAGPLLKRVQRCLLDLELPSPDLSLAPNLTSTHLAPPQWTADVAICSPREAEAAPNSAWLAGLLSQFERMHRAEVHVRLPRLAGNRLTAKLDLDLPGDTPEGHPLQATAEIDVVFERQPDRSWCARGWSEQAAELRRRAAPLFRESLLQAAGPQLAPKRTRSTREELMGEMLRRDESGPAMYALRATRGASRSTTRDPWPSWVLPGARLELEHARLSAAPCSPPGRLSQPWSLSPGPL